MNLEEEILINYNEIKNNLDSIGVPGDGVNWRRILDYADTYHQTTDEMLDIVAGVDPATTGIKMSEDQEKAWNKIKVWSTNDKPYFVLRGAAGAGKSYLTAKLKELKKKVYFTAPTNKAAKVLGNFVGSEAKTTFSQLGLRMSADDENLVMEYNSSGLYMPKNSILVVDEASMVGTPLFEFIDRARRDHLFKVFYVGDAAQLNPINEKTSPVWKITKDKDCAASLKQVVRFDNQILTLATRIRSQMQARDYSYPIEDDNDDKGGVYILNTYEDFLNKVKLDKPEDYINNKVVAWRNKTVTYFNKIIRKHLGFEDPYCVNEIVLIAQPVEEDGRIIANIDDEFTIVSVLETEMKAENIYIPVWRIVLQADISISVNIPIDEAPLDNLLNTLASEAKKAKGFNRKTAWQRFWAVRNNFHKLRYGYSVTTHRIQGSTLQTAMVDVQDILANKNEREAYRSLYVAATRPTQSLYTY